MYVCVVHESISFFVQIYYYNLTEIHLSNMHGKYDAR